MFNNKLHKKQYIRLQTYWLCFSLFLILLSGCSIFRTKSESNKSTKVIHPGKGYDSFEIGISTEQDIIEKLGDDFNRIEHGTYSVELNYTKQYLSFYYCQEDSLKTIFSIKFRSLCDAKTNSGIVLNQSTMREVIETYGKGDWGQLFEGKFWFNQYPGISFSVYKDTINPYDPFNEDDYLNDTICEITINSKRDFNCSLKYK